MLDKIDTSKTQFVDAYNQAAYSEIAGSITTRVNAAGHTMISEQTDESSKD